MKHAPIIDRARRLRQTQSVAGQMLWERLRRKRLNNWGFRRQAPFEEFVVDFLCHAPPMVVELLMPNEYEEISISSLWAASVLSPGISVIFRNMSTAARLGSENDRIAARRRMHFITELLTV